VIAAGRPDLRVAIEPLSPLEQTERLLAHDLLLLAQGWKGVANLLQERLDRRQLGENGLVNLPIRELRAGNSRNQVVKVLLGIKMEDVLQEQEELLTESRIEVNGPEVTVLGREPEARVSGRESRQRAGDEKVEHL